MDIFSQLKPLIRQKHLVLLGLLLITFPIQAIADSSYELKVCVFPMKPLNFIDNNGTAQGVYPDLLREIVSDKEWKISFYPGFWGDCFERVKNGELDLITMIGYSEERAKILDFNQEPVAVIS